MMTVHGYPCPSCKHPGPHPVTWHDPGKYSGRYQVTCGGGCGHDFTIFGGP